MGFDQRFLCVLLPEERQSLVREQEEEVMRMNRLLEELESNLCVSSTGQGSTASVLPVQQVREHTLPFYL